MEEGPLLEHRTEIAKKESKVCGEDKNLLSDKEELCRTSASQLDHAEHKGVREEEEEEKRVKRKLLVPVLVQKEPQSRSTFLSWNKH